jgi:Spy/CpxP family protein refolding chaperone
MWKQLTPEQREIIRQTNQERVSRRAANSNSPAK